MPPLSEDQLKKLKEDVLVEKMGWLCDELGDPGRYFPELKSKRVLNATDTQLIKTKPTDREKIEEFVTLISKRRGAHGQHGLDVFVEALMKQRVHAHVARTLLRAFNKKKAEAEKASTREWLVVVQKCIYSTCMIQNALFPTAVSAGGRQDQPASSTPTPVNVSPVPVRASPASSQPVETHHDVHPEFGRLPPPPPPSSTTTAAHNHAQPNSEDDHPQFGVRPPPPPQSSSVGLVAAEQEVASLNSRHSYGLEDSHSQHSDELGAQSIPQSAASMSTDGSTGDFATAATHSSIATSTDSQSNYSSLADDADLKSLTRDCERLKAENKQLKQDLLSAHQYMQSIANENQKLKEQLAQHRPTKLPFSSAPPPYYGPGSAVSYNSLTPAGGYYRTRNSSPSPGSSVERDCATVRQAHSSGSLSSHSSRGSYNHSESQV